MRYRKCLSVIVGAAVLGISAVLVAGPAGVGEVIRSTETSLNGVALPQSGTITPGSVLSTGEHGSALVQFSPEIQLNLLQSTSVALRSDANHLTAQMSAGTVGVRSFGTEPLLVETPAYEIGPAAQDGALYVVAMLPDLITVVSARRNSVSIVQKGSGEKYVVAEGHYAKVADNPQGVPPQTVQNEPSAPPAGLLASTGAAFLIAVGSGVGVAVVLDKTVLAPPTVSPSAP